ncbi:MAG: Unknown protein [uncultured Sulfurovum sp.]|uniref:Cadherin domain-containing protein n=1 Tax=uncultured Sulfurovum sp. TaxID=269237 RepID=A0A6S6SFC6_9BACT|nr:MAG: Unknown protein [uncultured Sulfurovum sp.]
MNMITILKFLILSTLVTIFIACGGGGSSSDSGGTESPETPDTVAPTKPSITNLPTQTKSNVVKVAITGEAHTYVYINDKNITVLGDTGTENVDLNLSGDDGVKEFTLQLKDKSGNISESLTFSITKDSTAPIFTLTNIIVKENQLSVLTVNAQDTHAITYTLSGTNKESFSIGSSSGILTFNEAPDYQTSPNGFVVTVIATDSFGNVHSQVLTVHIENVIENGEPTAVAGNDINLRQGLNFNVDGSASTDDGNIVKYEWFNGIVKVGEGSSLTLNSRDFSIGNNTIILRVTDDAGLKGSDNLTLNVLKAIKTTGQNKSYNSNGDEIDKTTTHDDAHYAKGIDSNYTRDDAVGTVKDNLTGLEWQDDAVVASLKKQWLSDANYAACTYDTTSDECYDTTGDTATAYCENLVLNAQSDWRLPTSYELENIIKYGAATSAIETTNAFSNTAADAYWTSTSSINELDQGWYVHFNYGAVNTAHKDNALYVRCVRK